MFEIFTNYMAEHLFAFDKSKAERRIRDHLNNCRSRRQDDVRVKL